MTASSQDVVALQAKLLRDKREFRRALDSLADATKVKLDLRRRIADRPFLWLATGLALGLGLGARK